MVVKFHRYCFFSKWLVPLKILTHKNITYPAIEIQFNAVIMKITKMQTLTAL